MFARKKTGAPSEAESLRAKHISTLKQYNPKARCLTPDEAVWDIPVNTQFGSLYYRLILPVGYPERPPELKLLVQATHPWVSPDLRITGHPRLGGAWSVHNNLGLIVLEISQQFERNPPLPYALNPPPPAGTPPANAVAAAKVGPQPPPYSEASDNPPKPQDPPSAAARQNHEQKFALSDVPKTFEQLDGLSTRQLQELLDDEMRFEDFFNQLPQVRVPSELRDKMYDELEALAKSNLGQKAELEELKASVQQLRQELASNKTVYQALYNRQQQVLQKFNVGNLVATLSTGINRTNEESERLISNFPSEPSEQNKLLEDYVRLRALYHLRAGKQERLKMLL